MQRRSFLATVAGLFVATKLPASSEPVVQSTVATSGYVVGTALEATQLGSVLVRFSNGGVGTLKAGEPVKQGDLLISDQRGQLIPYRQHYKAG